MHEVRPEVLKLWGPQPGGVFLVLKGMRAVSMKDIFILNGISAQHKIYIL
jgi:hypothetical protein